MDTADDVLSVAGGTTGGISKGELRIRVASSQNRRAAVEKSSAISFLFKKTLLLAEWRPSWFVMDPGFRVPT